MAKLNGVKVNNAKLPLLEPYEQAGVDPHTRMPTRGRGAGPFLKHELKKNIRINDEQVAINSVKWYNLPNGITQNLIERILYYRGQGVFFYLEEADQFFFLPYTLDGNIDVYGRFTDITPLPFNGTAAEGDEKEIKPWISGLKRHCIYDIQLKQLTKEEIINSCVLLHDYSCQISETNISRQMLNDPICDLESDLLPYCRTALLNSTGIQGMRVQSEDEQSNVTAASASIDRAALLGQKYIAIVGQMEFQDLTGGNVAKSEEFLMTMQSIDNYRLGLHGVDSGGIFQKQAHMLESENAMNSSKSSFSMQDRLSQRQHFCDVVNSVFGLNIWCDVSEPALGVDIDMDGETYDNEPNTSSYDGGNEPEVTSDVG